MRVIDLLNPGSIGAATLCISSEILAVYPSFTTNKIEKENVLTTFSAYLHERIRSTETRGSIPIMCGVGCGSGFDGL